MIDTSIFTDKRVAYYTLGCKLNFAETSSIGKRLQEEGFVSTPKGEKADLCVINTCSVTELADKKSRQTIRKIVRENPSAFVVVTGCYAQLKPGEVESIEGVDLIIGTEQKQLLFDYLGVLKKGDKQIIHSRSEDITDFQPSCSQGDRTRFFLKVQDGCDYFCSYCTVPLARGRSRNGTVESLVAQAREVAQAGGKEIVLTGVNIGDFGKSSGETFFQLVQALDRVEGIDRYRISSIEPNLLTDEIIDYVAQSQRFTPHFHIPLQSGSNDVLRLMKRRYNRELFASKLEKIRQVMPHAFIGVDVIVGTRGETEAFFEDAYHFIKDQNISQLHVFSYSERSGTQALQIEHIVSPSQKQERSTRLLELSRQKLSSFYQSQLGSELNILFEHNAKGVMMNGFSENYVRVHLPYRKEWANTIQRIVLTPELLYEEE